MKSVNYALAILLLWATGVSGYGQGQVKDYERAENLLRSNVAKLVKSDYLSPNWFNSDKNFWYSTSTEKGTEYFIVNTSNGAKRQAFNQEKLSKLLTEKAGKEFKAYALRIHDIEFNNKISELHFKTDSLKCIFNLKSEKLSVEAFEKNKATNKDEIASPDGKWIAFGKEHNIYVKNSETGEETQITKDGEQYFAYGEYISWYATKDISANEDYEISFYVEWSPDSKKLLIPKYDRRNVEMLYMYQSTPKDGGVRAHIQAYHRPIAGDSVAVTTQYYFLDIESKKLTKSELEPTVTFLEWGMNWLHDSKKLSLIKYDRGFGKVEIVELDAETGKVRTVHTEQSNTYVEPGYQNFQLEEAISEFFWTSEKDGWNHLYRYNWKTGELKKQLTKGDYFVRKISYIDTKAKKVYFMASGKEEGRDPYYQHFYSVNFDGKGLKLLSSEDAEHSIHISENKKYFVDHYSRFDTPNTYVLKRLKDGKSIKKIQTANIEKLKEAGWKPAELFKLKARDGKTDIYGAIMRPSNFDSNKSYPIIHGTYSGPHTIRTPKSFYRCTQNMDLALAELGFIVISVDGLGSAYRSKKFHDFSYKNLGDNGQPDFMVAVRQLKEKYNYLDTTRVGIYGHSAGGYDAAHALLARGHYYKVGVSSAGNHDHRIAKAWWPELYMGYPAGKEYDEQSNFNLAANLTGKLLLAHGDLDQNVNPNSSIRMMSECVKANRDVDLLLIPNADHGQLYWDKFFIRKRWDYFVEHLMGVKPPQNYKIK